MGRSTAPASLAALAAPAYSPASSVDGGHAALPQLALEIVAVGQGGLQVVEGRHASLFPFTGEFSHPLTYFLHLRLQHRIGLGP